MNSKDKSTKKAKKTKRKCNFFYDFVKITGTPSVLVWLRPKTIYLGEGEKKKVKGSVLITSNHVGFTDPLIIMCAFWYRRLHFVALSELFQTKIGNFFFTNIHCIKVDRENFNMSTFHGVRDRLKNGNAVVIFPEGHISESKEVMPFKSGAVLMAYMTGAPVLPVHIVDRKKWYSRQVVLVGDPIDVKSLCGSMPSVDKLNEVSEYIREKELALLEKYKEKYSK